MMIEPKQSDIGREVIYRVHSNAEAGGVFNWAASSGDALCALFLYDTYQGVSASKSPQAGQAPLNRP